MRLVPCQRRRRKENAPDIVGRGHLVNEGIMPAKISCRHVETDTTNMHLQFSSHWTIVPNRRVTMGRICRSQEGGS